MEKSLKFNSQVCTSVEQSKRLLKLGLKPETADMSYYVLDSEPVLTIGVPRKVEMEIAKGGKIVETRNAEIIPAWSLHRLIETLPSEIKQIDCYYNLIFRKNVIQYEDYDIDVLKSFGDGTNFYANIVDCIEWLIKEGYFNKGYLKQ